MPNKTIYVSDEDEPVYKRAQTLTGRNLSATIAQALRHFTQQLEERTQGFHSIDLEVGNAIFTRKRFTGRLLATAFLVNDKRRKRRSVIILNRRDGKEFVGTRDIDSLPAVEGTESPANEKYDIYQTPKGNLVLHVDIAPTRGATTPHEQRMEIYASLDQIREHIPVDLYEFLAQKLTGSDIENLDI
ncbi:MAG: hypothetical protein M1434_01110 [Chloroflexi bacterium]|nr:hypothetical protein [Chloroflexota bacterium]MCL5273331.1 hypothetical protein [Chloroflexota bacterium]